MTSASVSHGGSPASPWGFRLSLVFIAAFAIGQALLVPRLNINWDEYYFLSHVYAYEAGRLTTPLQTFHVHLLSWLPSVATSEADQIVAGRFAMLALECAGLWCVYAVARNLGEKQDAVYAVALWCAGGFALAHGMAFRADPLAAAAMMGALALLSNTAMRFWQAALAGVLAAIALLVTIKAVFYFPAFVAVGLIQLGKRASWRVLTTRAIVAGTTFAVAGYALYLWHSGMLTGPVSAKAIATPDALGQASEQAGASARKMFDGFLPREEDIVRWLALSLVPLGLLALSVFVAARQILAGEKRWLGFAVMLLAAPLLSVLFYRNAFPYFFPYIMFPVVVAAMPAIARLDAKWRCLLLLPMAAMLAMQFALNWQRDQVTQRATAEAAYRMFPDSVAYLDRNGMLARYPMVGGFGSTWGLEGHQAGARFSLIIEKHQPPLLIANTPVFQKALDPNFEFADQWLSEPDTRALQEAYIHHWGLIYVAGKELTSKSGNFDLLIAGSYTLECEGSRVIDATQSQCGDVINLESGVHSWEGGALTLSWGDHLYKPVTEPPTKPIYYGFFSSD